MTRNKIVLVVLVVLAALGTGSVFFPKTGVVDTAQHFISAAKSNNPEKSETYLTDDFRASTPAKELEVFLARASIRGASKINWGPYCISGNSAKLKGNIATQNGDSSPVRLRFKKKSGSWKISSIQTGTVNTASGVEDFWLPSKAESAKIAINTTGQFENAVAARDLTIFRKKTTKEFKEQFSARAFQKAFGGFIEQRINLGALKNYQPIFSSPPKLTRKGLLVLEGYFPTSPSRVYFKYEYVYRHIAWQIVGIDIQVRPTGS